MSIYHTLCILSAMAMMIAWINSKIGKVQTTIAITAGAMGLSLVSLVLGQYQWFVLSDATHQALVNLDFRSFLLDGVLGCLLFGGAISINLERFREQKWEIACLSLISTIISTSLIGIGLYSICLLIHIPLPFIYCLLFGALISPTDPIAVLAIIKKMNAPEAITTQIEGESLFNDGFGLVIFVTLFAVAFEGGEPTVETVSALFLTKSLGGIIYGLLLSAIFHYLIDSSKESSIELLLTILIPTSGYALAENLGVSGPLAMVVCGLVIGNVTRHHFSKGIQENLVAFWELIADCFNGILFLLIGLCLLVFDFHQEDLLFMVLSIPLVLVCRYISVAAVYLFFRRFRHYNPWTVKLLTWGGLRGGLALAMALSIPSGVMVIPDKLIDVRELVLVMTYSVVVFSILVQGSTVSRMIHNAKVAEEENNNQEGSNNQEEDDKRFEEQIRQ